MADFLDIFEPPEKDSKQRKLALFLKMLADLVDDDDEGEDSTAPPRSIPVRPDFFPSGGGV